MDSYERRMDDWCYSSVQVGRRMAEEPKTQKKKRPKVPPPKYDEDEYEEWHDGPGGNPGKPIRDRFPKEKSGR